MYHINRHVCDLPVYLCLSTYPYLAPKKITASRKHTDTNTEDSASYAAVNGRFPFYKPMKRSKSVMKMSMLLLNYIVILVRIHRKSGRFVIVSCNFHIES
jgi:hypothetical protein